MSDLLFRRVCPNNSLSARQLKGSALPTEIHVTVHTGSRVHGGNICNAQKKERKKKKEIWTTERLVIYHLLWRILILVIVWEQPTLACWIDREGRATSLSGSFSFHSIYWSGYENINLLLSTWLKAKSKYIAMIINSPKRYSTREGDYRDNHVTRTCLPHLL